jgi:hypothetical protein
MVSSVSHKLGHPLPCHPELLGPRQLLLLLMAASLQVGFPGLLLNLAATCCLGIFPLAWETLET